MMFSKVGIRPDAEDLTTEVFLSALRPLRVSASVGEVRAYLLSTARTVLAGHWRGAEGPGSTPHHQGHPPPPPHHAPPAGAPPPGRAPPRAAAPPRPGGPA